MQSTSTHHITPRWDGGTDHPWNLVEVPDHIHHDLHFARWVEGGDIRDFKSSFVALNATKNGQLGGLSPKTDRSARSKKTADTKRQQGTLLPHIYKMIEERDSSASAKKGWAGLTNEQRAAREAKRLETRRRNKESKYATNY